MKRMDEHAKIMHKQQEFINETKVMLQFLVKGKTKKKGEYSSRYPCISRKDKGKANEDKPHIPPGSTGGEEQ